MEPTVYPGFKISRDRYLNVLMFGDDLLVIQNNLVLKFMRLTNNLYYVKIYCVKIVLRISRQGINKEQFNN